MRIHTVRSSRLPRLSAPVVVCGALWLILVLLAAHVGEYSGRPLPSVCPLKRTLGIPCPTCGATRCVLSLMRGDVARALAFNPLVCVAGAFLAGAVLVRLATGRWLRLDMTVRQSRVAWSIGAAVVLANWVYLLQVGR